MPTTTLSTDYFIDSVLPTVSLETDLWDFTLTPHPPFTLSTDLWITESTLGILPTYNPSLITTVNRVQQNLAFPQFVIGGQGTSSQYALFKKSTSYGFYLWRTPVYLIGTDFDVLQITFPLIADLIAGVSIVPKLYLDDQTRTAVASTINLSNYPSGNKLITLTSKNFSNSTHGKSNFFLEFQILSSLLTPISLPIHITLDVETT
jgi:hypothetical protein